MSETSASQRPKQARSIRTEQALLDALERLLIDRSFADLTVSVLAREAGLTTGAIYRRFKDKEDVLRAAFQRFYERSEEQTALNAAAFPADLDDRALLGKYVSELMTFTLEHIHLMRAANHLNDIGSFELMTRARSLSADWLSARLTSSPLPEELLRQRTRFVLRVVTATFRDTFLSGAGQVSAENGIGEDRQREHERLCNNLVDLACGYLGVV